MRKSLLALGLPVVGALMLLALAACTSPLSTLKLGQKPETPVKANESRLVLNFKPSGRAVDYGYDITHIKYVVVQLNNKTVKATEFATGTVVAGTATIVFTGLVSGEWELMAHCYDWNGDPATPTQSLKSPDPTEPYLLYSGSTELAIAPGTSTSVRLLLFQPGDISSIDVVAAKLATSVQLTGDVPSALAGSPRFQVAALAVASDNSSLDTDQRMEWSSSNPDVAPVDGSGGVTPKNPGSTRITAKTVIGGVSAWFDLQVDPAVVGLWRYDEGGAMGTRYLKITYESSMLKVRYITSVASNSMSPNHYISDLTSAGDKQWQFTTNKRFDFSTGTEMIMAGSNYNITWNGQDQLTLNEAPAKTFNRISAATPVSSVTLPASPIKTGLVIRSKDVVAPSNATVDQVYFTFSAGTAMTMMPYDSITFNTVGSVTVTARSVLDPSQFATANYSVLLAVPTPTLFTAPTGANLTFNSIRLTWNKPVTDGNLDGVNVFGSTDGINFTQLNGVPVTVGFWDDAGLSSATEYFYYVQGVGGVGSTLTWQDSVPTQVISAYSLAIGNGPVLLSGPAINPGQESWDVGGGVMVPSFNDAALHYASQFYLSDGGAAHSTMFWFRAGAYTWMIYSLPLSGAPAGTRIAAWGPDKTQFGGAIVLNAPVVEKIWQINSLSPTVFQLRGIGGASTNISWNGTTMQP